MSRRRDVRGLPSRIGLLILYTLALLFAAPPVIAAPEHLDVAPGSQVLSRPRGRPVGFPVGPNVQGKVDFWKLIFTKYGKNELVFHHREYPEIIYSVLDLNEYVANYSGQELAALSNDAIEQEYVRIRALLTDLASGKKPTTPAERRIVLLFSRIPGRVSRNIENAMEEDQIRYQRGIKERFRESLVRSGRYMRAMERVFREAGLPLELCRIPFIESSFDYNAYSSVGAAGIWQFMRGTGKKYLRINAAIDERRDPIAATRAASRYLSEAYNRLQSWPLAVTSYNHGVTGILRAVNDTGSKDLSVIIESYKGSSFGFASKNFYAEFMAALEIEQNVEHYFPGLEREPAWDFDEVRLMKAASLGELVKHSGSDSEDIIRLNRSFMQPVLSGRARVPAGTPVKVPLNHGKRLVANFGRGEILHVESESAPQKSVLAQNRSSGDRQLRERPASAKPDIERPVIERPDSERATREGGAQIGSSQPAPDLVASASEMPTASAPVAPNVFVGDSYTVKPGDSLSSLGRRFSISESELRAANNLGSEDRLAIGRRLLIPARPGRMPDEVSERTDNADRRDSSEPRGGMATAAASSKGSGVQAARENGPQEKTERAGEHRVEGGETLGTIARSYGLSVDALKRANPRVNEKKMRPGVRLIIPGSGGGKPPNREAVGRVQAVERQAQPPHASSRGEEVETRYTVQRGDTVSSISAKLGVSRAKLRKLNPRMKSVIRPGDELVVGRK